MLVFETEVMELCHRDLYYVAVSYTHLHAQRRGGMISGRIISTEKETVDFATVYLKGTS